VPSSIEHVFVLGIDPGLTRCGYGLVTGGEGHERAIAAGVVTTEVTEPIPLRLATLRADLQALICEYRPDVVVVERVLFQTNARTAMSVGQASGVALLCAAEAGLDVAEYSSNEVKLAVAGYGAATKRQVQEMVASLLSLRDIPKPPDAADALALALCHHAHARIATALERTARPMSTSPHESGVPS
jgi:crossover junction endodeoxyribonuclease RuvC